MVPGTTDLTLRRGRSVVVVEAVPAPVCQACSEASLSAEVAHAVYTLADREASRGVALEFCTYAA
jgi:YgiT-type zinc finger domain-containing protein